MSKKKNKEFILCFKDFNLVERVRKPCIFVKIKNNTDDTKEDIVDAFRKTYGSVKAAADLMDSVGIQDGMWGLTALIDAEDMFEFEWNPVNEIGG